MPYCRSCASAGRRPRARDAVRHGIRHKHHARCRDGHRRLVARGLRSRDAARHRPQWRAPLSRLSLRPFHPCERRRARCALCLADDPAAHRGPCAGDAARRCVRLPAAGRRLEPALSGRRPTPDRSGAIVRLESRSRAGRGPGALRRLPHAPQQPRRRGQGARLRWRHDRGLVRAAAQRPLARRAPVDGGPASRLPPHRPQPGACRRRRPDGRRDPRAVRGARRRRARDRRLLRLPDGAGARGPAGQARTDGSADGRAAGASRGGDVVRRRLRGLSRARRADDAAGPAAARLGHAAAGGQRARHGAHHHGGPRLAGRPDRADDAGLRRPARRPSAPRAHRLPADPLHRQVAVVRHRRRRRAGARKERRSDRPHRQRPDTPGRCRSRHAAALRAAQRAGAERRQVRLRAGPMRRLHGPARRQAGLLLPRAGRRAGQSQGAHARGAGVARRQARPAVQSPSRPSRRRSAATASPA